MKKNFSTNAIHAGNDKDAHGALATPIYQTSTFIFDDSEQGGKRFALEESGYIYSRLGNPTNTVLEERVACLEGAEAAVSFGSGMGAITSLFWTLLKAGDHIVADKNLYGCTFASLSHGFSRYGVETTFVDTTKLDEVSNAIKENTKILYFESLSNPSLNVSDIKALVKIAKEKDILVVVDNTMLSPYLLNPIELGADVVVHSATKYLNGHGDVIAGIVCGKQELMNEVRLFGLKDMTGAVLSPFDAYLIIRGIKTLEIRMEKHCANASKVAEFLESHPNVVNVAYPGLKTHPQYEVAKDILRLSGGLVSFEVKGGEKAGAKLMDSLNVCTLAVSLGDAETLIQHPATMTHSTYTAEELADAGISEGLVRLSVGLEDVDDIISDLKEGLDKL